MPGDSGYGKEEYLLFDITKDSANYYTSIDVANYTNQYTNLYNATRKQNTRDDKRRITTWLSENNNEIYFNRQSRDMHKLEVCVYNIKTKKTRVIIKDELNTYIESRKLGIVNKGNEYIHWSERNGLAHLYLYSKTGKVKNAITKGSFHVNSIRNIDSDNRVIYFTANGREKGDPYLEKLYRVNFDGSGLRFLTKEAFNHQIRLNDSPSYFVTNYSLVNTAPKSALYNSRGTKILDLEETNLDRLKESGYSFPEPFKVKSEDGVTDIYGVMYKPFDFDPTKKYPIFTYVYPGPFTEAVNKSFSSRMARTDRVAQLGFIVSYSNLTKI